MFSTYGTIQGISGKVQKGGPVYLNVNFTSGSDTLTQINTIKGITGGYSSTNVASNASGINLDGSILVVGYIISSLGYIGISRDGGLTWIKCSLPYNPTTISDICFKGSTNYCGIYCGNNVISYADISSSSTFTNTSSLARQPAGVRFSSAITLTSGNLWLGFVGGSVRSIAGFQGTFSGVGQGVSTYCIDVPDDNDSYCICSGSWGMKFFSPTVNPTTQVSITGGLTNCIAMATSSALAKTICMTPTSVCLLTGFNTTTGSGGTMLTLNNIRGVPSTAGVGSITTTSINRKCAMSLNGNVIAFIDMNSSPIGICYYSVDGGSNFTNLNSQYSLTETFVSVQLSRGGSGANNYMILQSTTCVYKLSFGTQY